MTKLYLEVAWVPVDAKTCHEPCAYCIADGHPKLCHSITCDDVDGTQLILVPASSLLMSLSQEEEKSLKLFIKSLWDYLTQRVITPLQKQGYLPPPPSHKDSPDGTI